MSIQAAILATSPTGYYPLNDASGNPQDASGNGRHASGTIGTNTYRQASVLPAGRPADINGSMSLNSATSSIGLPKTGFPFTTKIWSWSTWMLPHAGSGIRSIFGYTASSANQSFVWFHDGNFNAQFKNQGAATSLSACTVAVTLTTDLPVHFAVTSDTTNIFTYVNGVLVRTDPWGSFVPADCGFTTINIGQTPADAFWATPSSRFGHFATWASTLTSAQVAGIYRASLIGGVTY